MDSCTVCMPLTLVVTAVHEVAHSDDVSVWPLWHPGSVSSSVEIPLMTMSAGSKPVDAATFVMNARAKAAASGSELISSRVR